MIGAGGVGVNAIQGARLCGASEIVAFDVSAERLDDAQRLGATATVDVNDADAVDRLRTTARRDGYDWTIVTVGLRTTRCSSGWS